MRSLRFHTAREVELVDVPLPEPGADEVRVRVLASALCGSELHAEPGTNPGHEAAGVIDSTPPPSSGFHRGDRVGISAVTGCGHCAQCARGRQIFCPDVRIASDMHAEYVVAPVRALRRLPERIGWADAVLLTGDAVGVPIRALRRVPHRIGDRVLVIGLGPVGLAHVLARAHAGAEVIAVEPSEYRRELALQLGAHAVVEPGTDTGAAPDLVIESTGIRACIDQALSAVAPGGTVLQSGWSRHLELNPATTVLRREIAYTGTWYYADEDYPEMVEAYRRGLRVSALVTHQYGANRISEAYETFVSGRSGKVVVSWE